MSFDHLRSELLDMLEDVSIPFEQGDVFRPKRKTKDEQYPLGLNPFRAGRCLSTPLCENLFLLNRSQSLSSRAMSFDCHYFILYRRFICLNPFRAGRCLSTYMVSLIEEERKSLNPFRAGRCLST